MLYLMFVRLVGWLALPAWSGQAEDAEIGDPAPPGRSLVNPKTTTNAATASSPRWNCSAPTSGVPARPGAGAFKCDVGSCLAFLDEGRPAARYTREVSDGDGVVYLAPGSDRSAARLFSSAAS